MIIKAIRNTWKDMIDIIDIPHLTIIHKRSLRIISFLFCDPPEFEVTVFLIETSGCLRVLDVLIRF